MKLKILQELVRGERLTWHFPSAETSHTNLFLFIALKFWAKNAESKKKAKNAVCKFSPDSIAPAIWQLLIYEGKMPFTFLT